LKEFMAVVLVGIAVTLPISGQTTSVKKFDAYLAVEWQDPISDEVTRYVLTDSEGYARELDPEATDFISGFRNDLSVFLLEWGNAGMFVVLCDGLIIQSNNLGRPRAATTFWRFGETPAREFEMAVREDMSGVPVFGNLARRFTRYALASERLVVRVMAGGFAETQTFVFPTDGLQEAVRELPCYETLEPLDPPGAG